MLLIENGYVIDPASNWEGYADILIENDKISKIGKNLGNFECTRIDATGKMIAPGLVDVHVHFRDPGFTYKEDIISGSKAAKAGGFTTVVLMANTKPAVDNEETLSYVLEKGKETGIHIKSCATVTVGMQGQEMVPMEALRKAGAAGFTDDGVPIMDEQLVEKSMDMSAKLSVPISFHEENKKYIVNNGINEGKASAHFRIGGSDRRAEIDLVERDLQIAQKTGAIINIQHISSKEAVELVRQAKKKGTNIHAEATPHHFTLTEDAVIQYKTLAKMNPPLREEEDRQAIIEGLQDGTIDLIATDHAPHSKEEKEQELTKAPSGIIGLETALALGVTKLVCTEKLSMMELIKKMSWNPAKMYGLEAGYIKENGPADLCIFDKNKEWEVKDFFSKSQNSPFVGWRLRGKVEYTICCGQIVYNYKN